MAFKDRVKNMMQISKGRVKEKAGSAAGDHDLEHQGQSDQAKGHLKQAGEEVKDAFREP